MKRTAYLNDQRIPKPTDVNVADKATRTATMREHPYASHISRFAVFPSFSSPDDPQTGVRAAAQPFPNLFIPNKAPDMTLLSKTIGGPYRHEILGTPLKTRKKAVIGTRENGILDQTKPVKEEDQGFYPTPSKIIHPNPRLRDWNLTLSERTSNMLKNLERTQWITSYQMQYSGLGAAIPMKIDDFKEKICNFIGMDSHSATQRENCSVWSDEHLMREPEPQNIQKADASQIANPERWPNLDSGPYSQTELQSNSRPVHQQQGSRSARQTGTVATIRGDLSLLDMQNSFSKSDAHRNFNTSVTRAAANLRDNVVSGRKHNFFGINCNNIRG
ncbi:sperm-associated microtubule inner protein 4 [Menidia menidia]